MTNPKPNQEDAFRQRERDLQAREMAIRLRELESEIAPPVLQTTKHDRPESTVQQTTRKFLKAAKFIGLVAVAGVVFVVVWRVATVLLTFLVIGIVAWVIYKLFLEPDRPQR
jgi:Flp pilus assembly protein TadB